MSFVDQIGTCAVRDQHSFDQAALERWLKSNVEGYAGPLSVEQFKGGQSNPTYQLSTPNRSYVMRRKPPGLLLKSAHAIDREALVLSALSKAGFPVPHVYGLCTDDNVIGTWFFVMEMVEGRIFWDAAFPDVERSTRPAYFDSMNSTIAQLHMIDPVKIGLGSYGKAGNYFARQIARWSEQYFRDEEAGRDPNMDLVIEWLQTSIPSADEVSIVHGDFRVDNMIFHPTEPKVIAVLDWELSTLGHPIADFAYHAMMYRMPPLIVPALAGADLGALNIPSEDEYVDAYCSRTGRDSLSEYGFALAFNFFRFAAIIHGIKGRYIRGTATNAEAKSRAEAFPRLAELAWEQAKRAGAA